MKNYQDNGEGVKHGVVHLQLRRRRDSWNKNSTESLLKTKNNCRRQVGRERTNEKHKTNDAVRSGRLIILLREILKYHSPSHRREIVIGNISNLFNLLFLFRFVFNSWFILLFSLSQMNFEWGNPVFFSPFLSRATWLWNNTRRRILADFLETCLLLPFWMQIQTFPSWQVKNFSIRGCFSCFSRFSRHRASILYVEVSTT